jgi:hypothetical protein
VGLLDPLDRDEVDPAHDPADGLPCTLVENVATYGLRAFKIKIGGTRQEDLARLLRVARTLRAHAGGEVRITLDGNEQCPDLETLASMLEGLGEDPAGSWLVERLVAIEQPLVRDRTFDAEPNRGIERLSRLAPVLIDEADADLDAFPRAAALGYRGVSVKNCKGVFRALINFGRCRRNAKLFQTAEDLTNLPVVALQQDLATVTTLGLAHVERNGHHYFRGLDHLGRGAAEAALAAHPDLYERREGTVALRIEQGRLRVASVHRAGFGYDVPVDREGWTPAEAWTWGAT